jgi:hypothetical protein
MKIHPYFKTTLATPFQGKHFHDVGTEVVMNMEVRSQTIGDFIMMLPDPVSLNLNNAKGLVDKSIKIKERINKAKEFTVFSKILTEKDIQNKNKEQIKEIDPDATYFRNLDSDKVFEYVQSSMGVVIFLVTAAESFANLAIPEDYKHERITKKGEKELWDKQQIVRKMSITNKLELISIIKDKSNLKEQRFWNTYEKVKELRDDIIHFKKMDNKIDEMWSSIITILLDSNLEEFYNDFVALIDFFRPGFLE